MNRNLLLLPSDFSEAFPYLARGGGDLRIFTRTVHILNCGQRENIENEPCVADPEGSELC